MEATFKTWKTGRKLISNLFDNYSLDQLNRIPDGFNNNLIWNIGHIIVVQQLLIYKSSNTPMYISDDLVNTYKTGTKPTGETSQAEANELKELLVSLVSKTEADFKNDIFKTYMERTTSTGFHLASVHDAVEFNNFHEGMHVGYMMSIRKFLR